MAYHLLENLQQVKSVSNKNKDLARTMYTKRQMDTKLRKLHSYIINRANKNGITVHHLWREYKDFKANITEPPGLTYRFKLKKRAPEGWYNPDNYKWVPVRDALTPAKQAKPHRQRGRQRTPQDYLIADQFSNAYKDEWIVRRGALTTELDLIHPTAWEKACAELDKAKPLYTPRELPKRGEVIARMNYTELRGLGALDIDQHCITLDMFMGFDMNGVDVRGSENAPYFIFYRKVHHYITTCYLAMKYTVDMTKALRGEVQLLEQQYTAASRAYEQEIAMLDPAGIGCDLQDERDTYLSDLRSVRDTLTNEGLTPAQLTQLEGIPKTDHKRGVPGAINKYLPDVAGTVLDGLKSGKLDPWEEAYREELREREASYNSKVV